MSDYLSSLGYPFRGRPMVFVFSVMMVWGVFLAARDVLIGWIAAFCFLLPFMCAFFMKMVRQSAMGEEDICPFPELDEWLDSLMLPFVRLVVCIIVSFLPFAVYAHTAAWAADTTPGVAVPGGGCDLLSRCIHENLRSGTFFRSFSRGLVGAGQKGSFSYAGLLGAICAGGWIILNLPSGPLMDFAMVPVKLYVACVLMNMCGLFMLKHGFAGEEEDGSFSPSGPAAS